MICSECGARIPDHLLQLDSFRCPECGTEYERAPHKNRYEDQYDDYSADEGYENYGDEPYDERGGEAYDDEPRGGEPYDDEPYDDEPRGGEPYYDDEPYDDEPYDDEPYDDEPYDDEPYDDEPYDGEPYEGEPESYGNLPEEGRSAVRDVIHRRWFLPAVLGAAAVIIALTVVLVLVNRRSGVSQSAADYISMFQKAGMPIGDIVVYNEKSDPNELLGRPNQYTAKASFGDTRLEQNSGEPNGGTVEIFADKQDMESRKEYVSMLSEGSALFSEYLYTSSDGLALIRISGDLPPEEAENYGAVLQGKPVTPNLTPATPTPVPTATPAPTSTTAPQPRYTEVRVPEGRYVVSSNYPAEGDCPAGTYFVKLKDGSANCRLSVYETVNSPEPSVTYELSALGQTSVDGIVLQEGSGIIISGSALVCTVY